MYNDEHHCARIPDNVEVNKEDGIWKLEMYEEFQKEFDDDGLVGFEKDYRFAGEIEIDYCPFCGEEF